MKRTFTRITRRLLLRVFSASVMALAMPLHANDIPDSDQLMAAYKTMQAQQAVNPDSPQAKHDAYTRCVKKARKKARLQKAPFDRFAVCRSEADAVLADLPSEQRQRMKQQAAKNEADAITRKNNKAKSRQ